MTWNDRNAAIGWYHSNTNKLEISTPTHKQEPNGELTAA